MKSSTARVVDKDLIMEWAITAARAADDKQGRDTCVLEVGAVLAITDYFVITSGANSRQVRTIADAVEEKVREFGGPSPLREEGRSDLSWVLIDYGDLVVHVFLNDTRTFYGLERLWADAARVPWQAAG